jgi:hypothetical protein
MLELKFILKKKFCWTTMQPIFRWLSHERAKKKPNILNEVFRRSSPMGEKISDLWLADWQT